MSKEAMKLALDELNHIKHWCLRSIGIGLVNENVLAAVEEALAKQEQGEPVGKWTGKEVEWTENPYKFKQSQSLYTTPPQRTWVGLTDEEINEAIKHSEKIATDYAGWVSEQRLIWGRSIEAKLKEKNT